jgi:hypothetical protein
VRETFLAEHGSYRAANFSFAEKQLVSGSMAPTAHAERIERDP